MAASLRGPGRNSTPTLLITACLGLALGLLVYLTDRVPGHASLLPALAWMSGHHHFGALGQWLPSFLHPFAFSLLTAATLRRQAAPHDSACVAWAAINLAFEFAQHPLLKAPLATALQDGLGWTPLAEPLANYVLRGTFDPGDLLAVVLGALAAAGVLRLVPVVSVVSEKKHGA